MKVIPIFGFIYFNSQVAHRPSINLGRNSNKLLGSVEFIGKLK